MVFANNFVVVIKCNGKVLREDKDGYVILPFGSEYSVFMKNLESRKAVVQIDIDGKSVVGNRRLIIQPNSELELIGVKEDSKVTNRFKFIKKTQEISDYRGDRIDDGLVRVEVTYEQKPLEYAGAWWTSTIGSIPTTDEFFTEYTYPYVQKPQWLYTNYYQTAPQQSIVGMSSTSLPVETEKVTSNIDNGITVKGSKTQQKFVTGYTQPLETGSTIIVLQLRGVDSKHRRVEKPISVSTKLICETCGRTSKSSSKYCTNCGTYLR